MKHIRTLAIAGFIGMLSLVAFPSAFNVPTAYASTKTTPTNTKTKKTLVTKQVKKTTKTSKIKSKKKKLLSYEPIICTTNCPLIAVH